MDLSVEGSHYILVDLAEDRFRFLHPLHEFFSHVCFGCMQPHTIEVI